MAGFLSARATPGVERVDPSGYHRTISARGFMGTISVAPMAGADALTVDVAIPDPALVPEIAERVARMFDVDTDPALVAKTLANDRLLKRSCAAHAGIRLPAAWDPFELAVRAILGQQISVRAATTIAGRVAARWGQPIDGPAGLERLFPSPATLADAPLEKAGIIAARARTIRELARQWPVARSLSTCRLTSKRCSRSRALARWTAQYVAMRALKHPDAFPSGDLVLRRMAGNCTARALEARSERGGHGARMQSCCYGKMRTIERRHPGGNQMRKWMALAAFVLLAAFALEGGAMDDQSSRPDDLEMLTRLNADYITSVQKGDVKRFDEILADDFLCSMADGSLIDRKKFLELTAQPVTIRNLQAHDVNIRLMGDMAIVHAATSYTTADGRPIVRPLYRRLGAARRQWLAVSAHVTQEVED